MFLPCLHSKEMICFSPSLDQEIVQFSSHFQLKDTVDVQVLPSLILKTNLQTSISFAVSPRPPLRLALGISDPRREGCCRLFPPSLHLLRSWLRRARLGLWGLERDAGRRKK